MSTWICPFCGNDLPDERAACCGEVWHAVRKPPERVYTPRKPAKYWPMATDTRATQ